VAAQEGHGHITKAVLPLGQHQWQAELQGYGWLQGSTSCHLLWQGMLTAVHAPTNGLLVGCSSIGSFAR
jgi:hypothetical protein